jgi:hypothetical protein
MMVCTKLAGTERPAPSLRAASRKPLPIGTLETRLINDDAPARESQGAIRWFGMLQQLTDTPPVSVATACYRAVAPNGLLIGSYPSRLEAAQAFSGVRS